jgi:undecaprenyl-diphosphatase
VNLPQSLVIALLQGMTELFPVSSLGHAVLLPALLRWGYDQSNPTFLPFLVLLHLGTAGALVVLYRREWAWLVTGFARASLRGRIVGPDERLSMLLVVGTVPGGAIGLVAEQPIKRLFANPRAAAALLLVNGVVLLGSELLRRRSERRARLAGESRDLQEAHYRQAEELPFGAALLVGACQALALLPGISRSGITIAGGLLAGLRHQEAARFSFLLATPIIAAAGLLEVPGLFRPGVPLLQYALGAVVAGLAAYGSARFLIRYFRVGRLDPYGCYCLAAGTLALIILR